MSKETRRAHVLIPQDLLEEVDKLVGPRRRSEFFVEAARERLERERLRKAAHEIAGFLKDAGTPHWSTPEATSAWLRALRRERDEGAFSDDREE